MSKAKYQIRLQARQMNKIKQTERERKIKELWNIYNDWETDYEYLDDEALEDLIERFADYVDQEINNDRFWKNERKKK